jgi:hypothetical protein
MDNFNRVMGLLAATALVALMFLAVLPAQAFSHDANYIYVYPNNAVRVLVNGSAEVSHEVPGNTSIAVTFYENSTLFRIHHTGLMPNLSELEEDQQWNDNWQWNEEQQPPELTGALVHVGYLNRTSNGRLEITRALSYTIYYNDTLSRSLNISYLGSIEVIPSPAEYQVTIWLNASWYPPLQQGLTLQQKPSLPSLPFTSINVSGVQVKEYKVSTNSTYLSLYALIVVNGTPAPPNTTLGMIQAALNAALTPGFLNASSYADVNFTSRTVTFDLEVNASNDLINDALKALQTLAEQGLPNFNGEAGLTGLQGLPNFNFSHHGLKRLKELANATAQIISYIEENFRVVVPSTFYVNVTTSQEGASYSIATPLFEKAGAENPKQSLAAITYLVNNASEILQENNLTRLARAVHSIDNVEVTLVGVNGVVVKPSQTTIGNLTSVTVTVPSGYSSTAKAATIGGTTAAIVILVALVLLSRRH